MKIGDRVLVLHSDGDPFYDGKIELLSDCGQYAKVREGMYASWRPIGRLRSIGNKRVETAISDEMGKNEPSKTPRFSWLQWVGNWEVAQ